MTETVATQEVLLPRTSLEACADIIPDERWNVQPRSANFGFTHLITVFGERVVDGRIQACSVEDMVTINAEIARRLLADERSHTPLLYRPMHPEHDDVKTYGQKTRDNNTEWLSVIDGEYDGEEHWPVPAYTDPAGGEEPVYDPHDSGDIHLLDMLLSPLEMQVQLTEAASYGKQERRSRGDDPDAPKGISLGEGNDEITLYGYHTSSYKDRDGINIVDHTSDRQCYPRILNNLLDLGSPEERAAYMDRYTQLADMDFSEVVDVLLTEAAPGVMLSRRERSTAFDIRSAGPTRLSQETKNWLLRETARRDNLIDNMDAIIRITNFNKRYDEQRNMTEAEKIEAARDYRAGILRVSDRLAGIGR